MSRFSPSEHAYRPSFGGAGSFVASSLSDNNTPATSAVALWFEAPKSRQVDSNTVTVAAWALQGEKSLVYALFQDSLPDFAITMAWLRQYQPPCIYWAFKNQGKNQNTQVCTAVTEWMEGLAEQFVGTDDSDQGAQGDNDNQAAAPLSVSVTAYESNIFKDSHRTVPALLQSLVEGNDASKFALKANIDLNNNGKSSPLCSSLAVLWHGLGYGMNNATHAGGDYEIAPAKRAPFLILDRAAASSLNLWPVAHQGQAAAQGATTEKDSLYGLLSKPCETAGGKRLLKQWMQQPLTCLETLQQRQQAVAHLVDFSVERDSLKAAGLAPLQIDLSNLASKLARYQHSTQKADDNGNETANFGSTRQALQTLYELYLVASQKIPAVTDQVDQVAAVLPAASGNDALWKTWSTVLPQLSAELQRSVALVEAVLDLEQAPREFLVQASYEEDLQELKDELARVEIQVEEEHAEMNQAWADVVSSGSDKNEVRLEYDDNWQFRLLKTNHSKVLRDQFANDVQVHRLLKNGVYFTTKTLRQLSAERRALLGKYDRKQRQVARDAIQVGATYHTVVARLSRVISQIDAVAALAHVSGKYWRVVSPLTLVFSLTKLLFGISLQQLLSTGTNRRRGKWFGYQARTGSPSLCRTAR